LLLRPRSRLSFRMLKVRVEKNRVFFGDRFSVSFQRTLRIPDDGKVYPLPPGLGLFPVHEAQECLGGRIPEGWDEMDLFIPLYQREALWLGFDGAKWKPNAVKVGVGKINVVSGTAWDKELHQEPQDYMVCPQQPWLDGINAGANFIRQFVATPLGQGYTVEAQMTGEEEHGGIQLLVYEPKPGVFPDKPPPRTRLEPSRMMAMSSPQGEMGLSAGGKMKQKIYPDPFGIDVWNTDDYGSVFVRLVNSQQYSELTGKSAPEPPINARTYTEYGLPWFDLYDETRPDLAAPESLARINSVREIDEQRGAHMQDDTSIPIDDNQVKKIR